MIPPIKTLKKHTLGATYEHINRLIKDKNFDAKEYVKYNENLDVFEKKVQAIIIDTFKLKEGVINCLLSNDPHLVRRVLKCDWFFEDALSPKCYEEKIFPNVSLSTRCKIINKLARNIKSEQDAEELFKFINMNYGSKFAEMFLAKCSFQFVSDYITNCNPSFNHHDSEKNLINICKRFPDIIIPFLQNEMEGKNFRGSMARCSKLINYLAKNHPLGLMPIFDKNYSEMFFFRFGKKSTKALHSELMKLFDKTRAIDLTRKMKMSVIFKHLSYEEQINFLKLLVQSRSYSGMKNWHFAVPDIKDLLELKSPNERVRMIERVFFELYDEKYLDHPETWSFQLLELYPEDYRALLVEILEKRNEDEAVAKVLQSQCMDSERDTKDTFIYLLGFKRAFPLLTELMNQMTTFERREILLKEMIRNCVINKDPEGFESVIKYISIRHKNEDPRLIYHLILDPAIISPKIMNLNIWNLLEKMATLLLIKLKDSHMFGEILEGYIAFKIRNNLDARPQIKSVLKLNVVPSPHSFALVRKMNKSYSKALIMLYYQEIFSGESDYAAEQIQEKLMLSLLLTVNDYNCTVRRDRIKIEDLPLLIDGIDKMMKNVGDWKKKHSLTSAVLNNTFLRNKYANFLLDFSMEPRTLRYLVKSHPDYVINSLDRIINYVMGFDDARDFGKLFVSRSQIDFLELMPKLEKAVCEKFRTSTLSFAKVNALKTYSYIASLEYFTELIKEYIPEEERFNFDDSKAEFHEIQINVPGFIKNLKPASKNLEFVLKYLKKDFLRWVLPSFLSVCHNSSANVIIPVLGHHLSKKDVSVKKVILSCLLDLAPKVERFKYCQSLWGSEKNSSVRACVFHAISRSLREDLSDEIFEMVKKSIREGDEVTIKGRLSMGMIPLQFLNEYSVILWEFTEKYEKRLFAVVCRQEIINHFNANNISVLSGEFCEKILRSHLFKSDGEIRVESFCSHYFLHHPQAMDTKSSFILELLRERRTKYDAVTYFIDHLKQSAKSHPAPVFSIFEALLKEWPEIYGASKMFKEQLLLKYMQGYSAALKISNSKNELFAAALGEELRKIVNSVPRYDCLVDIFNSTLSSFISDFNFNDILASVINNFLGNSFGEVEGIIAIHLIPWEAFDSFKVDAGDQEYKYTHHVEFREKYGNVLKKLLDKNDEVLKIYLNLRMDNALD